MLLFKLLQSVTCADGEVAGDGERCSSTASSVGIRPPPPYTWELHSTNTHPYTVHTP